MKRKKLLSISIILVSFFLSVSFTPSLKETEIKVQNQGWKILGKTTVKEGLDRDQIMVNAKKGKFRQLKVQVKKADVKMEKMIVHFNKNEKQVVWLRKNFKKGSWSKVVQIKGGKRVVQKVVLWYSQKDSSDDRPEVFLWGRQ